MRYFVSSVFRCAGKLLSPAGERGKLSILIYHRVLPVGDPLRPSEVDAKTFAWHMETLRVHFNVLPLGDAIRRLRSGTLPDRAASVTFDDGYADNYHIALPILLRFDVPATFFVATGYLDGGCMWNDSIIEAIRTSNNGSLTLEQPNSEVVPIRTIAEKRMAISKVIKYFKYRNFEDRSDGVSRFVRELGAESPQDLMMMTSEVKMLAEAGMEIGAHTIRHPILATLRKSEAEEEIRNGKKLLEALVGNEVSLFAYPNGRRGRDYLPEHVEVVQSLGFFGAVSTDVGVARGCNSGFELPRFTPWDRTPGRFIARLIRNCGSAVVDDSKH